MKRNEKMEGIGNPKKIWKSAKFTVIGRRIIAAKPTYLFVRKARPHTSETIPTAGNKYPFAWIAEIKAHPSGVNIRSIVTADGRKPNFEAKTARKKTPVRLRIVW